MSNLSQVVGNVLRQVQAGNEDPMPEASAQEAFGQVAAQLKGAPEK